MDNKIATEQEKIAIFSDIHGNLPSLEFAIEDAKSKGVTKIYGLGDNIGYWANTVPVTKTVKEEFTASCYGNHEENLDLIDQGVNADALSSVFGVNPNAAKSQFIAFEQLENPKDGKGKSLGAEYGKGLFKFLTTTPKIIQIRKDVKGTHALYGTDGSMRYPLPSFYAEDYGIKNFELCMDPLELICYEDEENKSYFDEDTKIGFLGHSHTPWYSTIDLTDFERITDTLDEWKRTAEYREAKEYLGDVNVTDYKTLKEFLRKWTRCPLFNKTRGLPPQGIARIMTTKVPQWPLPEKGNGATHKTNRDHIITLGEKEIAMVNVGSIGISRRQNYKLLENAIKQCKLPPMLTAYYTILQGNTIEFVEIYYDYARAEKTRIESGMPPVFNSEGGKLSHD